MSRTYQYHACPACKHPNVHAEKPDNYAPWRLRPHYASILPACPRCPGSLVQVESPREHPVARGSAEHLRELARFPA